VPNSENPLFDHYIAVRQSTLYEYAGISKSLLSLIASLIIGPRKEDAQGKPIGEPDPDEGWCVAEQGTLAAMMGCSRNEVCRQIKKFVRDGWLTKKDFLDDYGHKQCHYTITPEQLKQIKAQKMVKDENGEWIRAKRPSMVRKDSAKNFKLVRAPQAEPTLNPRRTSKDDGLSQGLGTDCPEAECAIAPKPGDGLSLSGVFLQ
jgi:hypothetical protein